MYYTGMNPLTGETVYVAKDPVEKQMQRALMQYRDPKNRFIVYNALLKAKREDLIGYGPKCLIRPQEHSVEKSLKKSDVSKKMNRKTGRKHD